MKIIDYDKNLNKNKIALSAYNICNNASFPVDYNDVYEHLFGNDNAILKLLIDSKQDIKGFGVFENYILQLDTEIITMLYLSGMVIDKQYQGKNISKSIIRNAYNQVFSDLISLRTQNIAMAKSLLNTYPNNLFTIPGNNINEQLINCLREANPFKNINNQGVIKNCYPNQLYYNLNAIKDNFGIELKPNDSLAVVIKPNKKLILKK